MIRSINTAALFFHILSGDKRSAALRCNNAGVLCFSIPLYVFVICPIFFEGSFIQLPIIRSQSSFSNALTPESG